MNTEYIAMPGGVVEASGGVYRDGETLQSWLDGATARGPRKLTPDNVLRHGLVWCGLNLIAGDIAQVPFLVKRRTELGPIDAPTHPLWRLLTTQPNEWQTPYEFFEWVVLTKIIWGNAIVRVRRKPLGQIVALEPIPTRLVEWHTTDENLPYYVIHWPDGNFESLGTADVLHFRGLSANGFWGKRLTEVAADELNLTYDATQHAASSFRNGARPSFAIRHPGKPSPEARQYIKDDFQAANGGPQNAGKPLVFFEGIDATPLSANNADAQLLEMLNHNPVLVGQLLNISPLLLHDLRNASTRANVAEARRAYFLETLSRHVAGIVQQLNAKLIKNPSYEIKADASELQKGDMRERVEVAAALVTARLGTKNEGRQYIGWNPVDGGDVFENPAIDTQESIETGQQQTSDDAGLARAQHVVGVECKRAATAARKQRKFVGWAESFYGGAFAEFARDLWPELSETAAKSYAQSRMDSLLELAGSVVSGEELAAAIESQDVGDLASELHTLNGA